MSKLLYMSPANPKKKIDNLIDLGEGIRMQIKDLKSDPSKPSAYKVVLSCSFERNGDCSEDQNMTHQAFMSKREKESILTERR